MARYYGTVQGARGEASRLGHRESGLRTEACSWSGKVVVRLFNEDDKDKLFIRADDHGSSHNPTGCLFRGTFKELGELISWWKRRDEINAVLALLSKQQLAELTRKDVK